MSDQYLLDYPFKNEPFLHQRAYLERFWNKDKAALFADMGTGKSFMLINNLAMLYDQGKVNAAVIVAPKGVYRNWAGVEIVKHMPEHIIYRQAVWNPSPRKAEQDALDSMFDITEDLKILIMNIEAFSTEKGAKFCNRFLLAHNAFMAIDESTTIKSPTAKRSKNILKVGQLAKVKRIPLR
jgi:SNF2 family DNA or RNA helicase